MEPSRLPVLSCAEMAAVEQAYLADNAALSWQLMSRAARGVADEALRLLRRKPDRILVLAGKGNNGADAFLAALHCAKAGTEIIAVFAEGGPSRTQAQRAWAKRKKGVKIGVAAPASLSALAREEFCLIFDGLLGQGFQVPLSVELRRFIKLTDQLRGLRIAVDLPSGLGDHSTGPAFRADLTVSIGCLKRPLLHPRAQRFVGRLRVLDIGLPLAETEETSATLAALAPMRRRRRANSDKRQHGRVLIVGGSEKMPGAVLMNTTAALLSGAALVTTCLPDSLRTHAAVALPEAMWQGLPTGCDGTLATAGVATVCTRFENKDVLLIGSGMGPAALRFITKTLLCFSGIAVLDADALRPAAVKSAVGASHRILLPHAGEFLRLSGHLASPTTAQAYARRTRSIVVLKGSLTCVTDGLHLVHIPFGGPVLARGGSGDLLAGIVTSVVARHHECGVSIFDAVVMAVTWHSAAADWLGDSLGEEAVRTTDVLSGLSPALKR